MNAPVRPRQQRRRGVRREQLSDEVAARLRTDIMTGTLRPGTFIRLDETAAALGVSITPVREAIAQLSVEGLIDIAPNRTRHVTRVTQKNALELIDVMSVLACAGKRGASLHPTHGRAVISPNSHRSRWRRAQIAARDQAVQLPGGLTVPGCPEDPDLDNLGDR